MEGYLFTGWDKNLATTRTFKDTTFTALEWAKGTAVSASQLSGYWSGGDSPSGGDAKVATTDDRVTLTLYTSLHYSASLSYTVNVAPVTGAAKFVTGTTAEAAMTSTDTPTNVSATGPRPTLTAPVTDEDSNIFRSSKSLYIKWMDANGGMTIIEDTGTVRSERKRKYAPLWKK